MEIGIMFNECECRTKIYAECTSSSTWLVHNSPNNDIPSQLNPFVIHGDNLCIVIPQNGVSNENLIALQNNSKHCIKYEWDNFESLDLPCIITVEPQSGYLKAGFTKLFHIIVKSGGHAVQMHLIPMKCNIYQYNNEVFREYLVPDGYFEYNDRGFYEKVRYNLCRMTVFEFTMFEYFVLGSLGFFHKKARFLVYKPPPPPITLMLL
jgi:hypothetical protein